MNNSDIQKTLALTYLTSYLGKDEAIKWMQTLRKEFATPDGMYQTAEEMICKGRYDLVLEEIGKIGRIG